MKLTVIGATGSMSGPEGAASCYLLQGEGFDPELGENRVWSLAIDLGPGSFGQLWRHIDPRELDAVLISHGHPDHLSDSISLLVFLKWHPEGPAKPMPIFGPAEIPSRIAQIEGYNGGEREPVFFEFETAVDRAVYDVGPFRIEAYEGQHTVESYGFRIEGPSDSGSEETVTFAYTGDTDLCDSMVEMARDVDLLLTECAFTDDMEVRGVHLTGTRAGELAKRAGAKKTVLTHIQPWTNPEVPARQAAKVLGEMPDIAVPGGIWVI